MLLNQKNQQTKKTNKKRSGKNMARFNLDDVQEQAYIDREGCYTLKIIKVAEDEDGNTLQMSANKSTPYHKYICRTQDGEQISVTQYITANSMWKYKAFLSACGIDVKGFVMDTDEFDPEILVGKKFVGEVKRCPAKINVETGVKEESKYFEVNKFYSIEEYERKTSRE